MNSFNNNSFKVGPKPINIGGNSNYNIGEPVNIIDPFGTKIMDSLGSVHGTIHNDGLIKDAAGVNFGRVDQFGVVKDPLGSSIGKVSDNQFMRLDGSSTGLKIGSF